MAQQKLTKKERRALRKQGVLVQSSMASIEPITPLTFNQRRAFEAYKNKNLMLHGTAGTGKTLISMYLALNDILNLKKYDKLVIVRSVVPSRDIGFLPGNHKEKIKVYESPYISLCTELFGRGDAYDILKQKQTIEFISTSYIRGLTLENSVILIDEIQNMLWSEMSTLLTRVGKNCKIILCGDTKQTDLTERTGKYDLFKLMNVCQAMNEFQFIQMTKDDICRSGFVKSFITKCEELGY